MHRILLLLTLIASTAMAEQRRTAFEAYRVIPREVALRLTRVAACEGSPQPQRWHFVIHDPAAENGLRDYVIADSEIASINGVSQFASEVWPEDVLPLGSARIDSTYVAQMASQYAVANSVTVASMNYDLHKDPLRGTVWKVTCLDSSSSPLGWLLIDAGNGKVLAQHGLPLPPAVQQNLAREPAPPRSDHRIASSTAEREAAEERATDEPDSRTVAGGFRRSSSTALYGEYDDSPGSRSRQVEVRRAEPVTRESQSRRRRLEIDLFRPGRRLLPF